MEITEELKKNEYNLRDKAEEAARLWAEVGGNHAKVNFS